jgi:hypothetical protein
MYIAITLSWHRSHLFYIHQECKTNAVVMLRVRTHVNGKLLTYLYTFVCAIYLLIKYYLIHKCNKTQMKLFVVFNQVEQATGSMVLIAG